MGPYVKFDLVYPMKQFGIFDLVYPMKQSIHCILQNMAYSLT